MKPFLEKVADQILKEYKAEMNSICIVFPSRRAGVFFRKYLSEKIKKPMWAPSVYSILDFAAKLSPYTIADKIILIFELFESYKTYMPDETFDNFYSWGEMLLGDFDEIDKNLVPADYVFRVIKEQRELEEKFGLEPEDMEEFVKFWRTLSSTDLSELQQSFVKTWAILGNVYKDFMERLSAKGIAYEGMAYRKIYEGLRSNSLKIDWKKVIFAGFDMLSKTEEEIIRELTSRGIAETFWDADSYYTENLQQEAGDFLRKNFKSLGIKKPDWIESNIEDPKGKDIKILGAPLQVSQVKSLGSELKKLAISGNFNEDNSAVILPDESLLMPLLFSLPEQIKSLNVTMGYPMKNTPVFDLIRLIKDLHKSRKGKADKPVYYHTSVEFILNHAYIKLICADSCTRALDEIRTKNIIYVSGKYLSKFGEDLFDLIFSPVENVESALRYLFNLTGLICKGLEKDLNPVSKFEKEYFYMLFVSLNRLRDILKKYSPELDVTTFWSLLEEVLITARIPFTGEPLKGLQVMGVLESRALDFENVFILSMNEGIFPRSSKSGSFIPYHLRKAFKMPTYDDNDSVSAYYFYRLLQRAKNVYLFYNTEPSDFSSGEMSRFIMQLDHEVRKANEEIKLDSNVMASHVEISLRHEISIEKSEDVMQKLGKLERFSASGFITYITCPLKFYFERIVRLEEEKSVEDFFSGSTFGNILHGVVKTLYDEYTGKEITKTIIDELKDKLDRDYEEILEKAFEVIHEPREFAKELEGKNLLHKWVIKKLAEKVLENDALDAPFTIVDLERDFSKDLNIDGKRIIKLFGRIDRIDRQNGIIRIIDYKTGATGNRKITEKNFEIMFSDNKFKEFFQTYFYAYLYHNENPDMEVKLGIYPLKNITKGIKFIVEGSIQKEILSRFESGLRTLAKEIFDSSKPFKQTKDPERCKYCPYISICYREMVE